ncbi:DUF2182 domain-containing protein [Aliiroseovarius subalbicans]|uniref:DUF2182 domain-containing protein n=1 Tax=Aliiroseovarius subalbicans TaxID=2925840 RepID=UPI001F55FF05|nr:DUF2182 domain-containing protein [Aliiroseovarius subalbicans]MCI2398535.1 DUF2182 domain-containing protein [Aliiroseovarius subalbicans]
MAAPHWLTLFGLILAGWAVLYAMALPADLRGAAQIYGAEFWRSLCIVSPDQAGYWGLAAMWAVMAAAMMAPTFLPALATYDDLIHSGAATRTGFQLLLAGYLVIWMGFSLVAAALQIALFRAGLVSPIGQSLTPWLSGALLFGAGAYQFSALKDACLTQCREPLTFFMQYWRPGLRNPLELGLRLGALCLGCCWALMLLGFVGGVMNLAFMGLATLVMIFEKLPDLGRPLTKPLGWGLMAAGLAVVATALI